MLITCPKCRTTYNVPSLAHHPDQKVRCVKCGHVWEPASDIVDPFLIDFALTEPIEKQEQAMPLPTFQDFFKEPEK